MIMEQPLPKKLFCNQGMFIHWNDVHFEINIEDSDMIIPHRLLSTKYQNELAV